MQAQRLTKGFTLIELGIALMIISILSATFTPGIIAAARTKLLDKMADDVRVIAEATMVFQAANEDHALPDNPEDEDCDRPDALNVLVNAKYLPEGIQDPWGGSYELVYEETTDGECVPVIHFAGEMAQQTLNDSKEYLINTLPMTVCTNDGCFSQVFGFIGAGGGTGSDGAPAGQIAMFSGECPLGWVEYAAGQGLMARGIEPGIGQTIADVGTTAGGSLLEIKYNHLAGYNQAFSNPEQYMNNTWASQWANYFEDNPEDVEDAGVNPAFVGLQGFSLNVLNNAGTAGEVVDMVESAETHLSTYAGEGASSTDGSLGDQDGYIDMMPAHFLVNYCQKQGTHDAGPDPV